MATNANGLKDSMVNKYNEMSANFDPDNVEGMDEAEFLTRIRLIIGYQGLLQYMNGVITSMKSLGTEESQLARVMALEMVKNVTKELDTVDLSNAGEASNSLYEILSGDSLSPTRGLFSSFDLSIPFIDNMENDFKVIGEFIANK